MSKRQLIGLGITALIVVGGHYSLLYTGWVLLCAVTIFMLLALGAVVKTIWCDIRTGNFRIWNRPRTLPTDYPASRAWFIISLTMMTGGAIWLYIAYQQAKVLQVLIAVACAVIGVCLFVYSFSVWVDEDKKPQFPDFVRPGSDWIFKPGPNYCVGELSGVYGDHPVIVRFDNKRAIDKSIIPAITTVRFTLPEEGKFKMMLRNDGVQWRGFDVKDMWDGMDFIETTKNEGFALYGSDPDLALGLMSKLREMGLENWRKDLAGRLGLELTSILLAGNSFELKFEGSLVTLMGAPLVKAQFDDLLQSCLPWRSAVA